ncbi:MAG: hypothetical protein CML13_08460 [Puniceicoccaceae bacterium]|nr:hypothetical protein [Puniceicoccaceae bacterium]
MRCFFTVGMLKTKALKHERIEEGVKRLAATLPVGARLPSERDLAQSMGVNFLTVRKALQRLVDEGIIIRKAGSGTFVAKPCADAAMGVNKVGLLMSSKSDAYSYRLMQSISNVASGMDLTMVPSWVDDYGNTAKSELSRFEEMGCLAAVIPWFPPSSIYDVEDLVESTSFPLSHPQLYPGFGTALVLPRTPQSALSLRQIIESICQYLLQVGATKLALLGPKDPENGFLENKVGAFSFYCATRGIPSVCQLVDSDAASMDRLAEEWAKEASPIGIISYDDEHALRFMTSMHKLGLSAPKDYRIIGNNDTEGSRYSDPPLTTVAQDFDFIATRMLRGALALALRTPVQQGEIESLPLVVRESCGGAGMVASGQIKIPRLIPRLSAKLSEKFGKPQEVSIPVE